MCWLLGWLQLSVGCWAAPSTAWRCALPWRLLFFFLFFFFQSPSGCGTVTVLRDRLHGLRRHHVSGLTAPPQVAESFSIAVNAMIRTRTRNLRGTRPSSCPLSRPTRVSIMKERWWKRDHDEKYKWGQRPKLSKFLKIQNGRSCNVQNHHFFFLKIQKVTSGNVQNYQKFWKFTINKNFEQFRLSKKTNACLDEVI